MSQKTKFKLKDLAPKGAPKSVVKERILVADDDAHMCRRLGDYLLKHGYEVKTAQNVSQAKEAIDYWHPDAIFVDLSLPPSYAASLLKFVATRLIKPKVILMARQSNAQGAEQLAKSVSCPFIIKPFSLEDALRALKPQPVVAAPKPKAGTKKAEETPEDKPTFLRNGELFIPEKFNPRELDPTTRVMIKELHLMNLFLKQAMDHRKPEDNLFNLMRMVSLKTKAERCSFIQCKDENTGVVLASNDDPKVRNLKIQLKQYPEVIEAMRSLKAVIVPHVPTSKLMAPVRDLISNKKFETIAVFPIFLTGKFFGVTSLRMKERDAKELYYVDQFGQIASQIIALSFAQLKG